MNADFRPLTPEERTELDNFTMKELEGSNGWLPIEDAPKDGTHVIGLDYRGVLFEMRFVYDRQCVPPAWHDLSGNRWVEPTYFMPLPNPPKK